MRALVLFKKDLKTKEIQKLRELGIKEFDQPLLEVKRDKRLTDYPTLIQYLRDHKEEYDVFVMPYDPTAYFYIQMYKPVKRVIMIRRKGRFMHMGEISTEIYDVNVTYGKVRQYVL